MSRHSNLLLALHRAGYTDKHKIFDFPIKPNNSKVNKSDKIEESANPESADFPNKNATSPPYGYTREYNDSDKEKDVWMTLEEMIEARLTEYMLKNYSIRSIRKAVLAIFEVWLQQHERNLKELENPEFTKFPNKNEVSPLGSIPEFPSAEKRCTEIATIWRITDREVVPNVICCELPKNHPNQHMFSFREGEVTLSNRSPWTYRGSSCDYDSKEPFSQPARISQEYIDDSAPLSGFEKDADNTRSIIDERLREMLLCPAVYPPTEGLETNSPRVRCQLNYGHEGLHSYELNIIRKKKEKSPKQCEEIEVILEHTEDEDRQTPQCTLPFGHKGECRFHEE